MSSFRLKKAKVGGTHTSISTGGGVTRSNVSFHGVQDVADNIVNAHNRTCDEIGKLCRRYARSLANEARRNAKWRDRESRVGRGRHARASIVGRTSDHATTTSIIVKGGEGVYDMRKKGRRGYYHFLEVAMGRRYATIKPTVNRRAPEVIRKIGSSMLKGGK